MNFNEMLQEALNAKAKALNAKARPSQKLNKLIQLHQLPKGYKLQWVRTGDYLVDSQGNDVFNFDEALNVATSALGVSLFTQVVYGHELEATTKFEPWHVDNVMECATMALQGLDQFNGNHNKVVVFREQIKDEYNRYRNQYTLVVACEAYGETGGEFELPYNPKRTAKSLKSECFNILKQYFGNHEFHIDL